MFFKYYVDEWLSSMHLFVLRYVMGTYTTAHDANERNWTIQTFIYRG